MLALENYKILLFVLTLQCCGDHVQKAVDSTIHLTDDDNGIVKYKSDSANELVLNFHDHSYFYKETNLPLKAGEDVGYEHQSRGTFAIRNDTLTFFSSMPSQVDVTTDWSTNTEFLPLYQTHEEIDANSVKIYFDNIAEPQYYQAFEFKNGGFEKLRVKNCVIDGDFGWIEGTKDKIPLHQYLLIEKPQSNKLLIIDSLQAQKSYFFDFDHIPFRSFHFYTRAYWSYYDFTGLTFVRTDKKLKLIDKNRLGRYQHSAMDLIFLKK
ncbi:hypothetical protein [Sphingobacterium sp. DR205]|uniref:hypothetical protein n=1 Tax=Sphingobacterium sp. DR205 TaxID=2713573 RepID=UPI0013E4EA7A|nr:hypothetical protein [Sphingobacterium sp. DR205]QIH34947.1 hypothetical protein G6053_19510 [Sphingobacterium sp. DR205]